MHINYHAYPKTFRDTDEAQHWILNAFPDVAIYVNEDDSGHVRMTWEDMTHQHYEMELKPITERVLIVTTLH